MTTKDVSMPDPLWGFVEEQAARRRLGTAGEYVSALVREAQKKEGEALLLEGIESGPAGPMTAEGWADIRSEARERLARGPEGPAPC